MKASQENIFALKFVGTPHGTLHNSSITIYIHVGLYTYSNLSVRMCTCLIYRFRLDLRHNAFDHRTN